MPRQHPSRAGNARAHNTNRAKSKRHSNARGHARADKDAPASSVATAAASAATASPAARSQFAVWDSFGSDSASSTAKTRPSRHMQRAARTWHRGTHARERTGASGAVHLGRRGVAAHGNGCETRRRDLDGGHTRARAGQECGSRIIINTRATPRERPRRRRAAPHPREERVCQIIQTCERQRVPTCVAYLRRRASERDGAVAPPLHRRITRRRQTVPRARTHSSAAARRRGGTRLQQVPPDLRQSDLLQRGCTPARRGTQWRHVSAAARVLRAQHPTTYARLNNTPQPTLRRSTRGCQRAHMRSRARVRARLCARERRTRAVEPRGLEDTARPVA